MSESNKNDLGDKRSGTRTAFNAKVKITQDGLGEWFFHTRDISDTGIFVCVNEDHQFPGLGTKVKVQMQGLPISAPVLDMIVIRKGMDGYGLQFVPEEMSDSNDK